MKIRNWFTRQGCSSATRFAEPVPALLEALEPRILLSVTLDNGLPTDAPDYFAVVLDSGGGTCDSTYAETNTIYDYFGYLEANSEVFNLYEQGSEPVIEGDKAISNVSLSLSRGSIDIHVESRIPSGMAWLINKYSFTASGGADLRDAIFFQYLDSDIYDVSDDVLRVTGSVTDGDLMLTTIDPSTHVELAQILGQPLLGAAATGFAADQYSDLKDDITIGGFDAAPEGSIDTISLPPGTFEGIGEGYGPEDVTSAIEYTFTNATSAIIRTTLGVSDIAVAVPDLIVTYVSEPIAVQAGDPLPVSWIVKNHSDTPTSTVTWTDAVFLSTDETWSEDDLLVGTLEHSGGLNAQAVYTASFDVDAVGIADGIYYVVVKTDYENVVEEARLEGNNATASESALWVGVPELVPGVPMDSTFEGSGTALYYVVNVIEGEHLEVTLDDANDIGHNELYIRYGQPPTRNEYDARYSINLAADQQVQIPDTLPGLYYVMAYGESVPDAPGNFEISADLLDFSILGCSPTHMGDLGVMTISIKGVGFDQTEEVRLLHTDGSELKPLFQLHPGSSRLEATFEMTGVPLGFYDLCIMQGNGAAIVLPAALEVQTAEPLSADLEFVGPSVFRSGRQTRAAIRVTNTGNLTLRHARLTAQVTEDGTLGSPLPVSWEFLSLEEPGLEEAFSAFVWDLGPGESVLIPLDVTMPEAGSFTLEAATIDITEAGGTMPAYEAQGHPDPYFDESGPAPDPPQPGSMVFTAGTDSATGHEGVVYYGTDGVFVAENLPNGGTQLTSWAKFAARYPGGWWDHYTRPGTTGADLTSWVNGQPPSGTDVANLQNWIANNVDPDGPSGPQIGGHPYGPWYKCTDFAHQAFEEGMGTPLIIGHNELNSPAYDYYILTGNDFPGFWPNACQIPKMLFDPLGIGLGLLQRLFLGQSVDSFDPNEKVGPAGYGPDQKYVGPDMELPYTIFFENDPEQATAPAQAVYIADVLDPDLDWSTFELSEIAFGDYVITIPLGLNYYSSTVDLRPEGTDLLVEIEAGLDSGTGAAYWNFASVDPDTLAPPDDPFAGFLPVNDETHRGEGHVSYMIRAQTALPTGAEIRNSASIVFDVNDPIVTNEVLNIIDAVAPSSSVSALPATMDRPEFELTWSGSDDAGGSGISGYDVYVSEDDGSFTLWLEGTTDTSATFSGQDSHTYAFYSVARDNVGHVEEVPGSPDVVTTVMIPHPYEMTLTRYNSPFFFTDATGDLVELTYVRNGQALVEFTGPAADGSDIESVVITGASSKSTFTVDVLTIGGDSSVGRVDISGRGFRELSIDGDVGEVDLDGIQSGKKVKKIIVDGKLGDVDASNVRRIDLIQADNIIGKIDAQEIKKLVALDDFDGADVTAAGAKGRIKELRAGDDVISSSFSAYKGISKTYIGGTVKNSWFTATGSKGKLGKFYISGDVVDTEFSAKYKLDKCYIGGDVLNTRFDALRIGKVYVGYDYKGKLLPGMSHFDGVVTASEKISRVYCTGTFYGFYHAPNIGRLSVARDYFRDYATIEVDSKTGKPILGTGDKDSWDQHDLYALGEYDSPSQVKKVYDKDGRQR